MTAAASAAVPTPAQRMLQGAVLPTLLRLSAPNIVGLLAATFLIGYDGFILGRLGSDALAGAALVLPLMMLMLQMSAGGLGGATTGAVARALGAGDRQLAGRLAAHALMIALAASIAFTLVGTSDVLYAAMGGQGAPLGLAGTYAGILFGGAAVFWACNVLGGIVRGTGEMGVAAVALVGSALLHVLLCPLLVFGWGPVPAWGVAGAAASSVAANALAALGLVAWLARQPAATRIVPSSWKPERALFAGILRVGLPASVNPILSNASIALATAWAATYGPAAIAGYGIAARLEYILVPLAFGVGGALTAMVATNMGARQGARAKQVAWSGAALVFGVTGAIGLAGALWPHAWMAVFTPDPAIRAAGATYLRIVGACYGFFGLGLALFFASQGAGRMAWPLVASSTRLAVVALGGWMCVRVAGAPMEAFAAVVAVSFAAYGITLAAAVRRSDWGR